jgi:glycosyltransferase involved in cell wall biosynthesis
MSKRTIALISYDLEPLLGGQGKHFEQLVWELEKKLPEDCWNILKISQKYLEERGGLLAKIFVKLKLPVLRYIFFLVYLNVLLPSEIRRNKIALILVNCGPGGVFIFFKTACKLLAIANHTYAQQIRFLPQQSWKRILQIFENRTYQQSDFIFSISSSTAQSLKADYNLSKDKIQIVPIGCKDLNVNPKLELDARKSLLFVGRLDERKGIQFLLESAVILEKLMPDFELNVVGKGPLFDVANTFIRENNLSGFVRLMGHVNDEHLQELYDKTAIFLAPSVFEGLGLAALSAAAQGIPVVARDVPGLSDIVLNGQSGFLTKASSPEDFAEASLKLFSDSELRKKMGEAGRQHVLKNFNWNVIIQSYLERIYTL